MRPQWRAVKPLATLVMVAVTVAGFARRTTAAPFQNLNFESATVGTPVGFSLAIRQALPDWTAGSGSTQFTTVPYDTGSTGAPAVSLQDGGNPYGDGVFIDPLQGSYSVLVQGGSGGPPPPGNPPNDGWLAQTGDVPSAARSLLFESDCFPAPALRSRSTARRFPCRSVQRGRP